jgi:mannonate dehydratase
MQETWRWFGPSDSITLEKIKQAGATGIVTSLHEIPTGEVWPLEAVLARKALIEAAGLEWSVIESIPVHNDIKTRRGDYQRMIANYQQSLENVGRAGVSVVCYNFMPVVDWTRTQLDYRIANSSRALRFEMTDFAAYDLFLLQRPGAESTYTAEIKARAQARFAEMTAEEQTLLEKNIIAGLPGGEGSYTRDSIRTAIAEFIHLGTEGLRANLFAFLREIVPVAEAHGVRLCIHPDDPPFSLFGLPRVVSTADDARALLNAAPSPANGLTLCAGSYGARCDNDLVAMAEEFGPRIYFVHLRNVTREEDGSFYEAEHLAGDNDMVGLIHALLSEERRRQGQGEAQAAIPMRPDHGHAIGEEIDDPRVKPGYGYTGRLKGLAELRGVIHTLESLARRPLPLP